MNNNIYLEDLVRNMLKLGIYDPTELYNRIYKYSTVIYDPIKIREAISKVKQE